MQLLRMQSATWHLWCAFFPQGDKRLVFGPDSNSYRILGHTEHRRHVASGVQFACVMSVGMRVDARCAPDGNKHCSLPQASTGQVRGERADSAAGAGG